MNKSGNIMIVDDTPANLEVLAALLHKHGYGVRPAINGPIAIQAARSQPPDLIILDISMPDMDGYEVCSILKSDPLTRHVPIIFISAIDETINKVHAFSMGGVDYITKPVQAEEAMARIETQLTLSRQRQALEQQYHELTLLREQERERFEELNLLKDQFVRTVSHDLKNPIGIIVGHIDMLEASPRLNQADHDLLMNIRRGAERMDNLIHDLLDLARIEAGVSLQVETGFLGNFLRSCVADLEMLAQQKDLTLIFDPPDPDFRVALDDRRIVQVLNNLLTNAFKYTPAGGQVHVYTQVLANDYYAIVIEDTGIGIPAEALPHIFERFYRVRHANYRQIEGTGLGLSIANAIVEQHSGRIDVESQEGRGSVFSVVLPKRPFYRAPKPVR